LDRADVTLEKYLLDIVDGSNVGMVQRGSGLSLDLESFPFFITGGDLARQELDGHLALELGVLSLIHHAHAAFAELGENLVVEDGFADHGLIALD